MGWAAGRHARHNTGWLLQYTRRTRDLQLGTLVAYHLLVHIFMRKDKLHRVPVPQSFVWTMLAIIARIGFSRERYDKLQLGLVGLARIANVVGMRATFRDWSALYRFYPGGR